MGVLFTYRLLVNFGRRGKELTHDVKNVIVSLSNKVHSSYKILGITDVHRRSVSIFMNVEIQKTSGSRKRKLQDRTRPRLIGMVLTNHKQTLKD